MSRDRDRRGFLTHLATTGAGLALQTRASGVPAVDRARGVELAVATIALDGFGDEGFAHAFRLAPAIGVRNVEFNVWYPRTVTPAGLDRIAAGCAEHGLTPVCLQGSAFGAPAVKDVAHKLWLMEQARRLGARRVKFTGARRGTEGGLDSVIEILRELAPAAEALDVLVLVENHANNNIETIEDYDRIFAAVPSPHVGMCLDMAHFDGANVDNLAVVERFHQRILHVDVKDTAARGVHKVVNYGTGVTDMHGILERLQRHAYSGYLVLEQAPPINRESLAADLIRAREMFSIYTRPTPKR